ncbi:hypothetical protein MRX96_007591 [Rhipicephalus microplus]
MKDAKKGAAGATTRVNSQSPGTGPPSKIGETRIQAQTKAEFTKEIQRLGALCESRTKELTMLKLQLRHASAGFASFAVHVQHLNAQVLQNNSFRIPKLSEESRKSQEEIEKPRIAIEKSTEGSAKLECCLEMRANQIQNLQHAKIELERKEEELDRCKVKMQKMEARIEDLQELLNEQFCGTKEEQ